MKFTGSLLSKSEVDTESSALSRHYVCCLLNVYANGNAADGVDEKKENVSKKIRRRYDKNNRGSVTRLSAGQVILGLLIIGCQLAPSYWQITTPSTVDNMDKVRVSFAKIYTALDLTLPGIWSGLFILVTGIVGLVAAAKNARCLIVTHLVLNSFAVLFALTVSIMSGISFGGIASCKMNGEHATVSEYRNFSQQTYNNYNNYNDYNNYNSHDDDYYYDDQSATTTTTTTTTTPSPVVLLGEEFQYSGWPEQRFYCTDVMFTIWIVMELVMALSGLIALALTITLIVKNSKALSLCCRRCCTVEEEKEGDADDASLLSA